MADMGKAAQQANGLTHAPARKLPPARPQLPTDDHPKAAKLLAELGLLAGLLDSRWRIPGTPIRFGMDAVVGLIPVLGDAATGLISLYILLRARDLGVGKGVLARMVGNVVLDTAVGSIPLLGSVFDVYFKANNRNIRLLRRHLETGG